MPDIKHVEIMAQGTWNGTKITADTLAEIVAGFEATKSFKRPHLKLGHNEEQALLAKDGLPAAGWVSDVYIKGKKLFADFVNIPKKVFDLIEKGAYRKVSVELFKGYRLEGNSYDNLLGAVALLGADFPAVASLNDILETYDAAFTFDENTDTIKELITFDRKTNGVDMPKENENADQIKDLEAKLEAATSEAKGLSEQVEKFTKDAGDSAEELKAYKAETAKKLADLEAENNKTSVEKFTLGLGDLVSPSMKPLVEALVADGITGKKEFSVGDEKLGSEALLEKLLKTAKEVYSTINTDEVTSDSKPKETDAIADMAKEIEEHMEKTGASQSDAYRFVMKNKGQ